jgi:hypothetical protein
MAYPDVKIVASFVYRCLREAVPGILQVVWDVVAMAAVHAMLAGRKHMWSRSFCGR